MAKQVLERLIDDMDGGDADGSVQFGLDGQEYSIDLSSKHEHELRLKLGPYLEVATRVRREPQGPKGRSVRGPAQRESDRERNQAIRQWCLDQGLEISSRGRIANAFAEAFDANDVDALYAAAGVERDEEQAETEEKPRRGRKKVEAEFSSTEA